MMVRMEPDGAQQVHLLKQQCTTNLSISTSLKSLSFDFSDGCFLTLTDTQLQDREVLVSLLVGAKYGMSQVINHKLNVISTLVEFSSISRVELLSESDKVSLLRISLHDMKV